MIVIKISYELQNIVLTLICIILILIYVDIQMSITFYLTYS